MKKMNEDLILGEIRKLTLNDELPIDKLLKKIINIASEYLQKNDVIVSKNRGISSGDLFSFLKSKGATHVTDKKNKHIMHDNRISIYPREMFSFYAVYTTKWDSFLVSPVMSYIAHGINVDEILREMTSDVDVKYGMLFVLLRDSKSNVEMLLIIPDRNHIEFDNKIYIVVYPGTQIFLSPLESVDTLPPYVQDWLYPSSKSNNL